MREKYTLNQNTKIFRDHDELSILFQGNINSVGAFIPFVLSCMIGLTIGLIYKLSLAERINPISRIEFLASLFILFASVTFMLAELTLKYEIFVSRISLSLISFRFNRRNIKNEISINQIKSIQKHIAKSTIGDTGSTKVRWPEIQILDSSSSYIVPVTLTEQDVDEIVEIIQDFISGMQS
jgi:hypothetical protein